MEGKNFTIHRIAIIDLLPEKEEFYRSIFKNGLDVKVRESDVELTAERFSNKKEFLSYLDDIAIKSKVDEAVIVHIISHGAKTHIKVSDSGETVTWDELGNYFYEINRKSKNNLILIFHCCKGYNGIKVTGFKKNAYCLLFGATKDYEYSSFMSWYRCFYMEFIDNISINKAFDISNKKNTEIKLESKSCYDVYLGACRYVFDHSKEELGFEFSEPMKMLLIEKYHNDFFFGDSSYTAADLYKKL